MSSDCNTKCCTKCGQFFPKTSEYFHVRKIKDKLYFRELCKQCSIDKLHDWNRAHVEQNRLRARKWGRDNKQRNIARVRAWNKIHPLRHNQIRKAIRKRNPERTKLEGRIYSQARRARKKNSGGVYSKKDIQKLYDLQNGRCWWNTKHKLDKGYHIDHRIPLSHGGSNDISNIVLSCPFCNLSKHDKLPDEFAGRLL